MPADPDVEALLAEVIRAADRPDITGVTTAADAASWCRLKVGFADGSTIYVGIGG